MGMAIIVISQCAREVGSFVVEASLKTAYNL